MLNYEVGIGELWSHLMQRLLKFGEINLMQVVITYCIDIFTKYYKVRYHSSSPYYTRLNTGKTKYMGNLYFCLWY